MIEQPRWLSEVLGTGDGDGVASHVRAVKLIFLRRYAAKIAYEQAGIGPADVDVALLYDHFSGMVILQLEEEEENDEDGAFEGA